MTTRDITDTFEELYGAQVSPTLVSKVTAAVQQKLEAWQVRGLEDVYPIIYLDCIHVSIRHEGRVHKKAIYVALGITMQGHKEVLGLWISKNEGAKFWLSGQSSSRVQQSSRRSSRSSRRSSRTAMI